MNRQCYVTVDIRGNQLKMGPYAVVFDEDTKLFQLAANCVRLLGLVQLLKNVAAERKKSSHDSKVGCFAYALSDQKTFIPIGQDVLVQDGWHYYLLVVADKDYQGDTHPVYEDMPATVPILQTLKDDDDAVFYETTNPGESLLKNTVINNLFFGKASTDPVRKRVDAGKSGDSGTHRLARKFAFDYFEENNGDVPELYLMHPKKTFEFILNVLPNGLFAENAEMIGNTIVNNILRLQREGIEENAGATHSTMSYSRMHLVGPSNSFVARDDDKARSIQIDSDQESGEST